MVGGGALPQVAFGESGDVAAVAPAPKPAAKAAACQLKLKAWEACGGTNTSLLIGGQLVMCGDAPCPGACCTAGYYCAKVTSRYHQCRPGKA